jgi:hypothetical protein
MAVDRGNVWNRIMPVPRAHFIKNLAESGLMPDDELRAVQDSLTPEQLAADDSQDFAGELVRQRKLTAWQATAIYQGKHKSLVFGNSGAAKQLA